MRYPAVAFAGCGGGKFHPEILTPPPELGCQTRELFVCIFLSV